MIATNPQIQHAARRLWAIRIKHMVADLVDHLADAPLWAVRAALGALADGIEDVRGEDVRDALYQATPVSPVDLMTQTELRRALAAIWRALPQEDRLAFLAKVTGERVKRAA